MSFQIIIWLLKKKIEIEIDDSIPIPVHNTGFCNKMELKSLHFLITAKTVLRTSKSFLETDDTRHYDIFTPIMNSH